MHEEADSRLILHRSHAALKGHRRIVICTGDNGVTLVIGNTHKFPKSTQVNLVRTMVYRWSLNCRILV